MAAEHRPELDWMSSTLSPSLTTHDTPEPVAVSSAGAGARGVWSSAVQSDVLPDASSHTPDVWDQLLNQPRRTGSGNNSDDADADDSAKPGDDSRPSTYAVGPTPPEVVTSPEITAGSEHVFSDVDYHVLYRHVMQGDVDDHVIAADRKSLESRKLILVVRGRVGCRLCSRRTVLVFQ